MAASFFCPYDQPKNLEINFFFFDNRKNLGIFFLKLNLSDIVQGRRDTVARVSVPIWRVFPSNSPGQSRRPGLPANAPESPTKQTAVISDRIMCEMQSSLESQVGPSPGAKAKAIHCLSNCMAERSSFGVSNLCAWHSLQPRFFSEKQALAYYYPWLRHFGCPKASVMWSAQR